MRRRLAPAAAATAALTALLLAGCTAGNQTSSSQPGIATGEVAPAPAPAPDVPAPDAPQSIEGGAASDGAFKAEADADRSVITTGWISITVDDPIATAEDAADLVEESGGRVDSRNETPGTDSQPPSASLTVRVPADELDAVVAKLRELGTVNSVSMNASDVTQQRQDLDARIDALTASVDRLRELLATATSITDLIAIESELTTRQAELDSLTQQRDWLVDQVDYSSITLDLITEEVAPDAAPDDFWSGLIAGWGALVAFAGWLGVAFGVLLPWLVAVLVVAAIVVTIVVLASRSRREGQLDAAASVDASEPSPSDSASPPSPPQDGSPRA
ncbi:DUF4349 domain-containing protein [Agromyces badenianii]|uniref:DUF4349 domain-containing protein n=1 Tax=Agromyces badenianii TaxID=2080742 RepID=A0A2S0WU07_9MICO|nr:DUF4349 domain-containing protein [Agromyces badenianii]AWB94823.1 DUF4349 domain-containing protein [Agromyces badenianii]